MRERGGGRERVEGRESDREGKGREREGGERGGGRERGGRKGMAVQTWPE